MVEYHVYHGNFVGLYTYLSYDFEILSIFFLNHNIIANWINCNYSWGIYDYDLGKWTGVVGQVNNTHNYGNNGYKFIRVAK